MKTRGELEVVLEREILKSYFGVDLSWPQGYGDDVRFFLRECSTKAIQGGFTS